MGDIHDIFRPVAARLGGRPGLVGRRTESAPLALSEINISLRLLTWDNVRAVPAIRCNPPQLLVGIPSALFPVLPLAGVERAVWVGVPRLPVEPGAPAAFVCFGEHRLVPGWGNRGQHCRRATF
jgi:hypothetical protein